MKLVCFIGILIFLPLLALCQTTKYFTPGIKDKAKDHRIIAVLPCVYKLKMNNKMRQSIPDSVYENMINADVRYLNKVFYNTIISKNYNMILSSRDVTDSIMIADDFNPADLDSRSFSEIASDLNVDALLFCTIVTTRPISESTASMLTVLSLGVINPVTSTVDTYLKLIDKNGELLFRYSCHDEPYSNNYEIMEVKRCIKTFVNKLPYK